MVFFASLRFRLFYVKWAKGQSSNNRGYNAECGPKGNFRFICGKSS